MLFLKDSQIKVDLSVIIAEQIYSTIKTIEFRDWYNDGGFDRHVEDSTDVTYEQVISQIREMFKLK
jgi:hypothetical protein